MTYLVERQGSHTHTQNLVNSCLLHLSVIFLFSFSYSSKLSSFSLSSHLLFHSISLAQLSYQRLAHLPNVFYKRVHSHSVPVVTTQLCHCMAKATRNNTKADGDSCVPIKLYLQNPAEGQMWPVGCSLPIPDLCFI